MTALCAVVLVDLVNGQSGEWLRIECGIGELFDVCILPGLRCPMSIGTDSDEIRATITFPPRDEEQPVTGSGEPTGSR